MKTGRPKGYPKSGGRKPGVRNTAETVRNAVMMAFDKLGGSEYLEQVGRTNPAVFITLLARILPHELAAGAGTVRQEIVLKWVTPEIAKARGWLEAPTEEETPRVEHGAGSGAN
jgi:hypothetical protein